VGINYMLPLDDAFVKSIDLCQIRLGLLMVTLACGLKLLQAIAHIRCNRCIEVRRDNTRHGFGKFIPARIAGGIANALGAG